MKVRFPLVFCIVLAALMLVASLGANTRTLGFAGRKADRIENQRFEKKLWNKSESTAFSGKTFEMKAWDKHFTPLGSKRAPITLSEGTKKQIFEAKTLNREVVEMDLSRWNERMTDLHEQAGIEMDDRAQLVADRQMYSMMLQDTQQFRDMADEVSLRDLNRYQFRRNRSDDEIPVEKAGSGN